MKRGFTLAELLVYLGLVSVFLGAVYQTASLTLRYFFLAQARSEAIQRAQFAVNTLERTLATSSGLAGAIYTTDTPACCLLLSAQPAGVLFEYDDAGSLKWQRWSCFYRDEASNQLRLVHQDISPTVTIPTPPGGSGWWGVLAARPSRILARDVVSASFRPVTGSSLSPAVKLLTYQVTITPASSASRRTARSNESSLTLSGQFYLRN